jgi:hypothetical protein
MTENQEAVKQDYWITTEELLDEANRIVFIEVEFKSKKIKLAWKEIIESADLEIEPVTKSFDEMTPAEQTDFNLKILTAEALARIKAAGEQEGCFNKNVITKEVWNKIPQRIRGMILNEMFQITKVREQRF